MDWKKLEEEINQAELLPRSYKSQDGFVTTKVYRGGYAITDLFEDVYYLNGFICGGYVRWMCSPLPNPIPAGDIDVYAYDNKAYEELKLYFFNKQKLNRRFENENAITFQKVHDPDHSYFSLPAIQLIKPIVEGAMVLKGDMRTILENFDFTIIRGGLTSPSKALVDADYTYDESNKILRLKNIHCPISSTLRCMKYAAKGYWLPVMECTKLFQDWDERDEEYKERIINFVVKARDAGITKADVDEFEKLARID